MFKVGQKVWFEPSDKREKGFTCIVKKVGRLYYTLERNGISGWEMKVNMETNSRVEWPHGTIFESEQQAKDKEKANNLFIKLKETYYGKRFTLEQMMKVYEILGIEIKEQD